MDSSISQTLRAENKCSPHEGSLLVLVIKRLVRKQPFSSIDYRPEIDTSEECNDNETQFFQNLIDMTMI